MPKYSEEEARQAIAEAYCWSDALRRLGLRTAGGNHRTLQRFANKRGIATDHFDPFGPLRRRAHTAMPLETVLVEHSTYSRGHLKRRLLASGLKENVCELCGQGRIWRDRPMSLILDHINGVADDHRLENLRIVCPNCAATLDTHCGRQNKLDPDPVNCAHCGAPFVPNRREQRYCSRACGCRYPRSRAPRPDRRKVVRPPYAQLIREVHSIGFLATGRRHGVSDNAVRKWIRAYEREREAESEDDGMMVP